MTTEGLTIEQRLADLEAKVRKLMQAKAMDTSDLPKADVKGPYAKRKVFYDPKFWIKDGKPSYKDQLYQDCPSDYLRALAKERLGYLEWAQKNGKELDDKKITSAKFDAAYALAWAKENEGL
jgi:hypothetical protein